MTVPTLTRRGYELDGALLPRVSTILQTLAKPSLQAWKDRVGAEEAARVSKVATELGSAIHAATEAWDRYWASLTPAEQEEELAMMDAYVSEHAGE